MKHQVIFGVYFESRVKGSDEPFKNECLNCTFKTLEAAKELRRALEADEDPGDYLDYRYFIRKIHHYDE